MAPQEIIVCGLLQPHFPVGNIAHHMGIAVPLRVAPYLRLIGQKLCCRKHLPLPVQDIAPQRILRERIDPFAVIGVVDKAVTPCDQKP